MSYSTLLKIKVADLSTEAEVETRLLAKLFRDLEYPDTHIIPKKRLKPLVIFDGSKRLSVETDFLLLGNDKNAKIIVEAKDPKINVQSAWGQAASYALSYNRDKNDNEKINWLLISNGHITSLFRHDSDVPTVTLRLSDFASGSPPYVTLRSHIKFKSVTTVEIGGIPFESIPHDKLNQLFFQCHDLVWKKEKLNPTDAFFEFCKFIFIKIKEDKKREKQTSNINAYQIPLTIEWLNTQELISKHPVRDILFADLHKELEVAIYKEKKKRIFEPNETLKLSASTCRELIKYFQSINLSSIDEDLNGRMFEVFLAAAIRGRALGQYFTPRPVVDFMTRIGLRNCTALNPPSVIDACSGTAGFLIEVMAYLLSGLREDSRFNQQEKDEIRNNICNLRLYGIEANERVARIARINMYLHGDGGSHIFHGDGLDSKPFITEDMTGERIDEVKDHIKKITNESFDLVLTNPPFSMNYSIDNDDEKRILRQRTLAHGAKSAKSNLLFLDRYHELLKPGGEILIVLDDTIINGKSYLPVREWIVEKFIILSIHSLPFNAFFKAKANIKTSILHLRKKINIHESQGYVFMSISNNIGHDNALRDTLNKNNLPDILTTYLEWQRTGIMHEIIKNNQDVNENLECPEQIWLIPPEELKIERFDCFYYSPDLKNIFNILKNRQKSGKIEIKYGCDFKIKTKLNKNTKQALINSQQVLKYIEIGDVTRYGLITKCITGTFDQLPSRGEYQVRKNDLLLAINNSSRGTVVKVPEEFDGAICTSGFLVITPKDENESDLLWYSLRSEYCRGQIYYLSQTASQPELKLDAWKKYFMVPLPTGQYKGKAIEESKFFNEHLRSVLNADQCRLQ
ncbi:N-6 DNA methylase [bacterium]|nr:N-6 DNA methylase [bacterium]MBU1634700.1 N-6 DNA methylase [bacterium]MBU1872269.1 N-6 DNA methylase [bacterium]